MTSFLVAALALLPPLLFGVLAAARGALAKRLAGLQFAVAAGILELVVLTFPLGAASSIDLALTAAVLSYPASVLFAVFAERWL